MMNLFNSLKVKRFEWERNPNWEHEDPNIPENVIDQHIPQALDDNVILINNEEPVGEVEGI